MKTTVVLLLSIFSWQCLMAEPPENEYRSAKRAGSPPQVLANCTPPTGAAELDINNVRALIQSGGDMWWDFNRGRYEVPKGSGKVSLFAGSLWLAGQDVSGQFKVAAMRYRGNGNDYWTGPLSLEDAEIDPTTCRDYDRQWITSRSMIAEFNAWFEAGKLGTEIQSELFPGYTVPDVIKEWPGNGRSQAPYYEAAQLAPYFDYNDNGVYDWENGDYPGYVLRGKSDCSIRVKDLYGDQNIWWVFNDKGNVHSETGGLAIGMEIRAQAFAFTATDEVNNMTFYNYELINRSTFELRDTYFGQWADGDVGNGADDFVGCDVQRGLGYFYNSDDFDEDASGNLGYGNQPPAIGIDFFQGPFQASDKKDNCLCEGDYNAAIEDDGIVYPGQGAGYGDGKVDNERYGMRKFLYHNRVGISATEDPRIASDYYNMLRGIWKDGTPMTFGGDAYDPQNPSAIQANYMYPGTSDPLNWGTEGVDPGIENWTEFTADNSPDDRRFVQSSGPFTLAPGAINNITVGIVWAQAQSGGAQASVEAMRRADDKTQALFDACFEITDGPHAPDVVAQELDQRIILMLDNPTISNNYNESFAQVDPFLTAPDAVDSDGNDTLDLPLTREEKALYATFTFEGYKIYQLADASVGVSDLEDPDKARLVAQVDIENDIDRLINYEFDPLIEKDIPVLKVDGANQGIRHSFEVTEDLFSTGDARLVNHKTYYFMAIAYAQNNYGGGVGNLQYINSEYDPTDPEKLDGQKLPYVQSRTAATGPIRIVKAIPHKTEVEFNGVSLNASYGDGVKLTRVEGLGNGGRFIELEQLPAFVNGKPQADALSALEYAPGEGPVEVKVVDPLAIPPGDFTLAFTDPNAAEEWADLEWMIYAEGRDTVFSDRTVAMDDEQIIFDLGISVKASFGFGPKDERVSRSGAIGATISFDDETDRWLTGIVDADQDQLLNWIKSGDFVASGGLDRDYCQDDHWDSYSFFGTDTLGIFNPLDPRGNWENIGDRTWAPFAYCSYDTAHPIPLQQLNGVPQYRLSEKLVELAGTRLIPSVNVYITSDKSLWTRCPVFEAGDVPLVSEGAVTRGELRRALSVDKNGYNQLDPEVNLEEATMGGDQVLGDLADDLRQQDRDYFASLGFETQDELRKLSFGMGWFPGYAIDVETGERLNMAFAEDSWLGKDNGNDMQWNPTATIQETLFGELRLGGKHMIYVFGSNREDASLGVDRMMPAYDQGQFTFEKMVLWDPSDIAQLFGQQDGTEQHNNYLAVWGSASWAGYPILAENSQLFGDRVGGNSVEIKLRASVPFQPFAAADQQEMPSSLQVGATYYVNQGALSTLVNNDGVEADQVKQKGETFVAASTSYSALTEDLILTPTVNDGRPLYTFSLDDLAPTFSTSIAEEALQEVEVVPNPYYAYSEYETQRLENVVKVINLPQRCSVTIYSVDGQLVRSFDKDDPTITSVSWDLDNEDNIPIASGVYIVHVDAPGIGERVLKWFGVLRPIDLNSF